MKLSMAKNNVLFATVCVRNTNFINSIEKIIKKSWLWEFSLVFVEVYDNNFNIRYIYELVIEVCDILLLITNVNCNKYCSQW